MDLWIFWFLVDFFVDFERLLFEVMYCGMKIVREMERIVREWKGLLESWKRLVE